MTIEELRKSGWIAYEYRRGSHMYHLNVSTSDEDTGGVFICPPDMLNGLRSEYIEQIADEKNDTVFYEFGRWIELLLKSNPTALESLYAPKDCIIGEVHPAVQYVLDNRDMFLSKECFKTFYGYAVSQMGKARGLNKKIVNPVTERKEVLDFCYTFFHQGSQPIKEWLAKNGLKQEYCGLVNTPNMRDVYSVFYDWGNHYKQEFEGKDIYKVYDDGDITDFGKFCISHDTLIPNDGRYKVTPISEIKKIKPIGYRGIVAWTDDIHESNEVRLSSVPDKNAEPICFMYYNKDAYTCHCRDYKEYKEWEEKRNPVRYESNLNKNYDSKNIMHCMRLVRMAKELAQGKGFNVVRTWDRDYLLDIRNHKFEYDEVMAQLETEKSEMEKAIESCTLRDKVDLNAVNELLIESRKKFYKGE